MRTEDLLKELGQKVGLPDLALDQHNICRLIFDNKITIDIEPDADQKSLFVYTTITQCPAEGQAEFFQKLLTANAFGQLTGNAFFCVDPDGTDVMLQEKFQLDELTFEAFFSRFESFVERTEDWLRRVEAGELNPDLTVAAGASPTKSDADPTSCIEILTGNVIRG